GAVRCVGPFRERHHRTRRLAKYGVDEWRRSWRRGVTASRFQRGKRVMLLTVILFTGCSKSNLGVVTGTISVDGAPAKRGSIAFFPTNRKSSTAGSEIVDGRYTAKVALGTAKV